MKGADMRKVINILCAVMAIVLFCCGVAGCAPRSEGIFYTLEEAYEVGWLTRDDLMEICYNRFGEVWIGESLDDTTWIKYEYEPKDTPSELDRSIENDIKETYYSLHKSDFFDREGNPLGGTECLTVRYFGMYNDSYVVVVECSLWDVGQAATPMLLAGVAWWETGDGFLVYRDNKE